MNSTLRLDLELLFQEMASTASVGAFCDQCFKKMAAIPGNGHQPPHEEFQEIFHNSWLDTKLFQDTDQCQSLTHNWTSTASLHYENLL